MPRFKIRTSLPFPFHFLFAIDLSSHPQENPNMFAEMDPIKALYTVPSEAIAQIVLAAGIVTRIFVLLLSILQCASP
jgi:hypothetical protein